jgi:hypothetical protein
MGSFSPLPPPKQAATIMGNDLHTRVNAQSKRKEVIRHSEQKIRRKLQESMVNARNILILTGILHREFRQKTGKNRVFYTQIRPRAAALTMPELTMASLP